MSDNIFKEIRDKKQSKIAFESLKSNGYRLMQEGKIDAKTYYSKTRDAGIELGLIDPQDYPGRLPGFAKSFLEIVGGTAGAVGGFVTAGPVGMVAGAGAGAGAGSLASDFLGDLLAPDMPAPSTEERIKDAATTAVIDSALTAATPIAGRALKPVITKMFDTAKAAKTKILKEAPDASTRLSIAERTMGLTDEAAEEAKKLAKEGVPLSLGQASSNPVIRGAYDLLGRMPIAGAKPQEQLAQTFKAVDEALSRRISPSAKVNPLTETERSELIKEFGMKSFKDWRASYKSVYKKAEKEARNQGDFFDINPLRVVALRNMPKTEFEKMPTDVQDLMLDINLYGDFFVAQRKRKPFQLEGIQKRVLNFDDIEALDFRLKDLSRKYDPARSTKPNNRAYQAVTAMQKEMKQQLRNPETTHGRLYSAGDRLFKEYMSVVEDKTGKEFQKALTRGALRPGVGRPASQRLEDLYKNTFGDAKSPAAVQELRKLIGVKRINVLAANYLDDVFTKHLRGDKRNFAKLYDELGFNNLKSKNYEATKELLKDYKSTVVDPITKRVQVTSVSADDLFGFLDILKQFPEALPDVNTFIMRSGILRSAQSLGPGALIGTTGISLGGGFGALAGFGFLRLLASFLARPYNKNLLKEAGKGVQTKRQEFIQRFLQSIPKLPDVPVSALAVQPLVPAVEQQITQ
jgi:hypothetical protein